MMHLLYALYQTLSQAPTAIYFEQAPTEALYPYAVYKLPSSIDFESDRQDFRLEIDVWDNQSDTTQLETITTAIDRHLHKARHLDEHQLLIFQRESRLMLPDNDPDIRRRQLRYIVKTYERVN